MATVYKTVDIEVDVDADDLDKDELIEAVESMGYLVIDKDDCDSPDVMKEKILLLKDDFLNWYQFGMSNEVFEKTLKQFFLDTVDEYIS